MTQKAPFPLGPRGPFVLLGVLGQGATGAVYRAHDQRTQREVAVKFVLGVNRERQARFAREGELTASLRHPGILQVHDAGLLEGVPYLVYELVPNARTFEEFRETAERPQALLALRDAAAALGHAHARGVIHRDVKPDNLLVSGDGRLVVADFGLAAARDAERLTRTGALLGTPLFMAPDKRYVITASKATESTVINELRVWRCSDRTLVRTTSLSDPPCNLRLSPNGEVLAVGTFRGVVEFWAAPTLTP